MAGNKFATMVHRSSNKMTLVLVYVLLEWTLIALLLLNSLFSFLILKFADYFGLKRPCPWCSTLFEPGLSHRDLLCEAHATEVSNLSFCLGHRRLAEASDMCEDCSASSEAGDWPELFPWDKRTEDDEKGEDSKCSCCGVGVSNRRFYSPCILIKPWGVLDYPEKKKGLLVDDDDDDDDGDGDDKTFEVDHSDHSRSDIAVDRWGDGQVVEETREVPMVSDSVPTEDVPREIEAVEGENVDELEEDDFGGVCEQSKVEESVASEAASEIPFQHLEFFIGQEDCTLIPVEEDEGSSGNRDFILDFDMDAKAQAELVTENWRSSPDSLELIPSNALADEAELEEVESTVVFKPLRVSQGTQTVSDNESGDDDDGRATGQLKVDSDAQQGSDDDLQMQNDEIDGEISIGTDIPDHEIESEDPSTSSISLLIDLDHELDLKQAEEEPLEFKPLCVQTSERELDNDHSQTGSELNEIEEEKFPDTPTSADSLHLLHKKFLLHERTDLEGSLDGSVISDTEGVEGIPTVESLKSALKAERKALNALYMELEEERSASAVAASQTMAMINRLQEEKAAMQMEALQYQRMMEEQSEYDQEALQLLNELMMKREREKQELEKKVIEYEARERMALLRRSRNSSACCSNTEDSDGISIDTNNEAKEEGEEHADDPNTPEEAVHCLEESLVGFEEERLSILDQLRVLEEKLFSLSDGEKDEYSFEDIKLFTENGNGFSNGHFMGAKAKRLLPFFDAEADQENGALDQNGEDDYAKIHDETVVFEFEHRESKKLTVEEEVDHVYERLQALEADREFLKHCISSLKKGDKGLFLLHEILQHLRDLRNVEHSVKNVGNGVF